MEDDWYDQSKHYENAKKKSLGNGKNKNQKPEFTNNIQTYIKYQPRKPNNPS